MPDKIEYQKPALTLDQQLDLLESRGLEIGDREQAKLYLQNISYYRLSGYTRYFAKKDDPTREKFRDGATFEEVINLYVFDRKLRVLFSEAFERIEVAVKGSIAHHGAIIHGPFWVCAEENFDYGHHGRIIDLIDDACVQTDGKYKQVFLDAFFNKYSTGPDHLTTKRSIERYGLSRRLGDIQLLGIQTASRSLNIMHCIRCIEGLKDRKQNTCCLTK